MWTILKVGSLTVEHSQDYFQIKSTDCDSLLGLSSVLHCPGLTTHAGDSVVSAQLDCKVAQQLSQNPESMIEFFQKALGPVQATQTIFTSCHQTVIGPLFEAVKNCT
jgi:hypothetical protein